ncbi:ABC transporter substrate-binding protein [Nocardioides lianchengensis]|uniref:Peptide/nickel transport system substrate-binding protein n=1 Tax=Nocardioides lianchengensis TaxID=1045774 RepID=A0A1G6YFZ8_9ACTN|nr:ABC transporter substrate-binding protein [Nocardioides lianchengensis]NYG09688.1 peptide/nickel transport system substrate-binding protein [Nocardioides lianchengensis]SDD88476.1 peptide/nickel transport system substrate-binding protein [Nocardioides lianchengensis]
MKRTKSLAAVACVALISTLAACGGDGGGGGGSTPSDQKFEEAGAGFAKVADAEGPAPEIEGAATGGDVTVYVPLDEGPEDLDPTNGWSVLGNSIQQALTHRSLTQYRKNDESGEMELVPDLATDLGTPNDDFTEWTFTVRDDVKWETGDPITPEEIKYGIERSFDSETFTSGPGQVYSVENIDCGDGYAGPADGDCSGITVEGQDITIKMVKPFPDMDFWGSFMAIGPIPLENSDFPAYGRKPLSNGPYKISEFRPTESLTLVKNDQWDPATDPARHQYVDSWTFKFNQDQQKTDQILLSDSELSSTAISYRLGASNATDLKSKLGDNYIQQTGQCVSYRAPDYTKITDINVRKAIAWAYDFDNVTLAGGNIPGVTRIPASTLMPPGMSGRKEYFPDGEQFTYQPEKAKQLLEEAGQTGMTLTYVYDDSDATLKAAAEAEKKGYEAAGFKVEMIPYQEDYYALYDDKDSDINKRLNLRNVNWCSDWPSASTMIPPLVQAGQPYNTAFFDEPDVQKAIDDIATLPAEEQPTAWGDLDEMIGTEYFPLIPLAYRNELYGAGASIGNFNGDGAMSSINFKDLFVTQ